MTLHLGRSLLRSYPPCTGMFHRADGAHTCRRGQFMLAAMGPYRRFDMAVR